MHKFRLVFLGVASALVLGTGTALANVSWNGTGPTSPTTVTADADAHGDAVSAVAKTAPKGEGDEHGDAVSKVASAEGQENRDGARAAAIAKCRAGDVKEDASEKKPVTKADRTADRIEDRKEHKAFVACVKAAK